MQTLIFDDIVYLVVWNKKIFSKFHKVEKRQQIMMSICYSLSMCARRKIYLESSFEQRLIIMVVIHHNKWKIYHSHFLVALNGYKNEFALRSN